MGVEMPMLSLVMLLEETLAVVMLVVEGMLVAEEMLNRLC
jgi:hypothetical protein